MGIFIILGLHLAAFFIPILAKVLIYFDYVMLLFFTWLAVLSSHENTLLYGHDVHTVFQLLILLAALGIWFGLQQIRVFRIYIFRVLACAIAAFALTHLAAGGLFGQSIADGMDTIWMWTVGIIYFVIALALRAKNSRLMFESYD